MFGFRVSVFRFQCSVFRFRDSGFKVLGSGIKVKRFKVDGILSNKYFAEHAELF